MEMGWWNIYIFILFYCLVMNILLFWLVKGDVAPMLSGKNNESFLYTLIF